MCLFSKVRWGAAWGGMIGLMALTAGAEIHHAQGEMAGEPGTDSIILHSRLTAGDRLNEQRAIPGARGVARFVIDRGREGAGRIVTPWLKAEPENDFIVRHWQRGLTPNTRYRYRLEYGAESTSTRLGPERWFCTLPGSDQEVRLSFLMFSCMSWGAFMDGYANRQPYAGPDKALGYPTLEKMRAYRDAYFVVGAGDLVYYDSPSVAMAKTLPAMRAKWQQQFSLPRLVEFVGSLGSYWMKDDHDFRYDDADLTGDREPSAALGLHTFREQMPVVPPGDPARPTYRTVRASAHAQLWFVEGRDFRSPKVLPDGPNKSIWGVAQREWLQRTLLESDAVWKLIVTPTPMLGPDTGNKRDNHANLAGYRHEAESFFDWLKIQKLRNVVFLTGDRHWQYHSIHPTGVPEFACGSLHREIAVGNPPKPGQAKTSDPEARITQKYATQKADGGFMRVVIEADSRLRIELINQEGEARYAYEELPDR